MTSNKVIYIIIVSILLLGLVSYIYKRPLFEKFTMNEYINNMTLEEYLDKILDYSKEITLDNYEQSCKDIHTEFNILLPKIKELEELDSLRYNQLMDKVKLIEEQTLILSNRGCRQFNITLL